MKQDGKYAVTTADYKLPVCDVQKERRNYPGVVEYENMLPMTDEGGTTDTDSKTDKPDGGYSSINKG